MILVSTVRTTHHCMGFMVLENICVPYRTRQYLGLPQRSFLALPHVISKNALAYAQGRYVSSKELSLEIL